MREHGEAEVFSNPLPPESHQGHHDAHQSHDDDEHPLTNDDFRKLLMTPGGPAVKAHSSKSSESRDTRPHHENRERHDHKETEEDDAATRRRKKKSYYAKLKKIEDERQKELDKKYRDRARERRDGSNADTGSGEISTTADYRAVAPDVKIGESYAERRKQIIQESKYLGGDMEHTHLVKGLDFALLEKVRAEITSKEVQDDQIEEYLNQAVQQQQQKNKAEKEDDPENFIEFRTKMARNIYRVACKPRPNERNELFLPRRMAYVVDLEDEYADSDIPTTLIRSKADCVSAESTTIMSTNDIVINKLTQILTYLRQGKRDRKKLKKEKGKKEEEKVRNKLPGADEGIYPDSHDIYPMMPPAKELKVKREPREERSRRDDKDRRDRDRRDERDYERRERDRRDDRDRRDRRDKDRDERKQRKSYFEKPADEDDTKEAQRHQNARDLVKSINDKFSHPGFSDEAKPVKREEERMKKIKKRMEIDSYAECYPGMEESADAVIDSDEEADYTKMDMGNKKGPVGRWDFENQEEYSNYMSSKEALPKAAFQYGVKMADGRKTRRAGPKDEKAQLDRQWQKIQNLIQKRKGGADDHGSSKKPRH